MNISKTVSAVAILTHRVRNDLYDVVALVNDEVVGMGRLVVTHRIQRAIDGVLF